MIGWMVSNRIDDPMKEWIQRRLCAAKALSVYWKYSKEAARCRIRVILQARDRRVE